MHFENYLNNIKSESSDLATSIVKTTDNLYDKIKSNFDFRSHITGLLLGNVQSGKTAQMFGVISKMADEGYEIFIVLSTDNIYLQQQTLHRATESLTTFNIFGENDDVEFLKSKVSKPIILILKKNTNILKKWRNLISSSNFASGRPITFFDDEADAASINTLVNKQQFSKINNHLNSIKQLATSSIFIQVTATPQAVLLQSTISGWKPSFIQYFSPGNSYIGGDFIYSEPTSYCIRFTEENEFEEIKSSSDYLPIGLRQTLLTFLVICSEFSIKGKTNCNFLVHPSVRIADHERFAEILGENLNTLLISISDEIERAEFINEIKNIRRELQNTQPDLSSFEEILEKVEEIITQQDLSILVINSKSSIGINYNEGFNIIVGGNSLGRGLTLKNLQVVYYSRRSKTPQADTYWQHSRAFGYDRVKGLLRVYIPPTLHELFKELNSSNRILINQIISNGLEGLQIIYPKNIKPTRKNVLDKGSLNILVGGVNFFPKSPSENNVSVLDSLLQDFDESDFHSITGELMIQILSNIERNEIEEWSSEKFVNCINALIKKRPSQRFSLIVRRDRDIGRGTGTLLSPIDRLIGDRLEDSTVLTIYRVKGSKSKGWLGNPFWIPNIKFPEGVCFYDSI